MKYYGYDLEIDLNADKKRFCLGTLSAINHESNDSMPISLNPFAFSYAVSNEQHPIFEF